jgi:hypothetical protein
MAFDASAGLHNPPSVPSAASPLPAGTAAVVVTVVQNVPILSPRELAAAAPRPSRVRVIALRSAATERGRRLVIADAHVRWRLRDIFDEPVQQGHEETVEDERLRYHASARPALPQ